MGLNPDMLHLIGHSLGAHISGVAGSILKADNISIGRITGKTIAISLIIKYFVSISDAVLVMKTPYIKKSRFFRHKYFTESDSAD